ncbi:potassium channel family protein [Aestuariivita boseongensis]|uniref:potassium channel family protein n=1 Tax=Aestuariivita boseongensis TaxID=1470562 RepID=UPI000681C7BE|nr:TrkA family potassium uptake protein [Aestuariivita boseongensis]
MHISVLGASRFGVATVRQFIDAGHEVVLIDQDRDRLDALSDDLDCAMICGDGTLPSTLRDAYGDGSDALVVLTNADDVNVLAAVVGRSVGYKRVIPQIVRTELLSVAEELDLSDVIAPHESVARSIYSALVDDSQVETEMALHRELRFVNHAVPQSLDGTAIGKLDLPEDARAVAYSGEDTETFADTDVTLRAGDHLFFVATADAAEALREIFATSDDTE